MQPLVFLASIVFIVGSLVLAAAQSYGILVAGRLIVGLGVGIASMIIPVYIGRLYEFLFFFFYALHCLIINILLSYY